MGDKNTLESKILKCEEGVKNYTEWVERDKEKLAHDTRKLESYIQSLGILKKNYEETLAREKEMKNQQTIQAALIKPFSFNDWCLFITHMDKMNARNGLIVRLIMRKELPPALVLSTRLEDVDTANNTIHFKDRQNRNAPVLHVRFPPVFFDRLKTYINYSKEARPNGGFLFVTRNGESVSSSSVYRTVREAGFGEITPEVLHATYDSFVKSAIGEDKFLK